MFKMQREQQQKMQMFIPLALGLNTKSFFGLIMHKFIIFSI